MFDFSTQTELRAFRGILALLYTRDLFGLLDGTQEAELAVAREGLHRLGGKPSRIRDYWQ